MQPKPTLTDFTDSMNPNESMTLAQVWTSSTEGPIPSARRLLPRRVFYVQTMTTLYLKLLN